MRDLICEVSNNCATICGVGNINVNDKKT